MGNVEGEQEQVKKQWDFLLRYEIFLQVNSLCKAITRPESLHSPLLYFCLMSSASSWVLSLMVMWVSSLYLSVQVWVANLEHPRVSTCSLYASPTGLSPYLRFGCLSCRVLYYNLRELYMKVLWSAVFQPQRYHICFLSPVCDNSLLSLNINLGITTF